MALGTGPIRKRDDERIRRNKDDVETETVTAIGTVPVPDLGMHSLGCAVLHPVAKMLYESLKNSAQSRFYEESDWAFARLTTYILNDMLNDGNISAMKLTALNQMFSNLLLTEGDRRRVRLEIERTGDQKTASVTSISDIYKERLGLAPSGS